MFVLRRPSQAQIQHFIASQRDSSYSYPEVGATRLRAPLHYQVDHNRAPLGRGIATFESAKRGIRQWRMFAISWLTLHALDAPIEPGTTVAVVSSHFGFWALNACRIVYVIDEPECYGFAYGTVPAHAEIGEERFTVEFHSADESVWYDIYAFSRPRPLIRLANPLARRLQKRFAQDSMAAMRQAVEAS